MDARHSEHLKPGVRVAVYMGIGIAEMNGSPPLVTTATVLEGPVDGHVWLGVDFTTNDAQLPQRYRVSEVIGFMLPLAEVTHHEDGSTTGTFPLGTVTPDGTRIGE